MAERRFVTTFEFGEIQAVTQVTSQPGVENLSGRVVDAAHKCFTGELVERGVSCLSNLVGQLKLEKGDVETNIELVTFVDSLGYKCELHITITLEVKIANRIVEALFLYVILPKVVKTITTLIGADAWSKALEAHPDYEELLTQTIRSWLGGKTSDAEETPGTGQYL